MRLRPKNGLRWLYPYDQTVWPRGLLAPLLQWQPGAHTYEAVRLQISDSTFDYDGYFGAPTTPFQRHPIPQSVWKQLTYSNGGDDVKVTLTFASGGVAYGPIQQTWKIAKGELKGDHLLQLVRNEAREELLL